METSPQPIEEQLRELREENARLKAANEELEKSCKESEEKAERMVAAIQTTNEELQQFVYAASHDLQEPLRSISTYSQLLERRYASDKEANEYTRFIVDGVNRMNTLIRDLLTYSRTGSSPKRTMVKLDALVQWSILNLQQSIRDAGAEITCEELPELYVDESQMVQLFQNLLSNALKYCSGEAPRIAVTAEEGPEQYTILVKDNGQGIAPRFHKQVFGVFKRLHGREIPGTGIGLALCRKIVEGHGGQIWVESDGTNGSTFKFTLPA
jgi:light-regulated signal transduction histidine kinase (bacteriophytochrome)